MVPGLEVEVQQFELLHGLKALLEYHRSSGIGTYPKNEDTSRFLDFRIGLHTDPSAAGPNDFAHPPIVGRELNAERADIPQPPVTLAEIADEVAVCRACNLCQCRIATRAGRGGDGRVKLLVVGSWLSGSPEKHISEEIQFGIEEDQMLSRMLTAINIRMEQTFITNAVKCVVPENIQPIAENARICLSFLFRQISLLAPDCICTMGMMATRALLGLPQPLSQLRGRFHSFRTDGDRQIPVMATYHPSYLLQNPEMKKAAWLDLQVNRKMARMICAKLLCMARRRNEKTREVSSSGSIAGKIQVGGTQKLMVS